MAIKNTINQVEKLIYTIIILLLFRLLSYNFASGIVQLSILRIFSIFIFTYVVISLLSKENLFKIDINLLSKLFLLTSFIFCAKSLFYSGIFQFDLLAFVVFPIIYFFVFKIIVFNDFKKAFFIIRGKSVK